MYLMKTDAAPEMLYIKIPFHLCTQLFYTELFILLLGSFTPGIRC
jgi:hypothetical protein